ncbi:hypothetical protein [Natronoglycomyces albus]|uniref:Uncharacterized protein n=1 Tax=Natronoglycomyces albus TaxID=2811108 RepID=A0A895XTN1_9ACTN|nr:hypothetical protein [Natronoglycomyces albus]QSB05610.1 hypothetical protein JQS30_01380 [Natronoglycomyces albus]
MSNSIDPLDLPKPPPILAPVPSVRAFDIHGARVVVGSPGVGWMFDLRADDPVTQDGKLKVPVLPESEYYRAIDEETTAQTCLYPADQVWVETEEANPADQIDPMLYLIDRLVDPDQPERRKPLPASEVPALMGRRVWYWHNKTFRSDYRCVTEPFEVGMGDICVRIAEEAQWYRWHRTGVMPRTTEAFLHWVWVQ